MPDKKPRITSEGFHAMRLPEDGHPQPPDQEEVSAILARLRGNNPFTQFEETARTFSGGGFHDPYSGDINMDGYVTGADRALGEFLAGEAIGTPFDPSRGEDPVALMGGDEAQGDIQAGAASSKGHQFLKNYLMSLLPADADLDYSDIVVPIGVGGEPDVMAALRINVFPRVGQADHDHPYYEEAMVYQQERTRDVQSRASTPAFDLGGTPGVDFAARLRESALNR